MYHANHRPEAPIDEHPVLILKHSTYSLHRHLFAIPVLWR